MAFSSIFGMLIEDAMMSAVNCTADVASVGHFYLNELERITERSLETSSCYNPSYVTTYDNDHVKYVEKPKTKDFDNCTVSSKSGSE